MKVIFHISVALKKLLVMENNSDAVREIQTGENKES